jgi:PAS domain S-box-containing protein
MVSQVSPLSLAERSLLADLQQENQKLRQENSQLQQDKVDLEILLENNVEHADVVAYDLQSQAAQAKQQVEEQFRLIAEATPVGILICHQNSGALLYSNQAASQLLSITTHQLNQYRLGDFFEDPNLYPEMMARLTYDAQFQGECKCLRPNAGSFWGLLSLRPFAFKEHPAILISLHDISDRKSAEEALRLAEEKYRSIFENALEGIYQSSLEGRYLSVNPAMATIHGFDSPAAMLAGITEITQQVYVNPSVRDQFQALIATQGHVTGFEYQIYRCDGTIRWVSENARAVRNATGHFLYYEGILHDVTERKQRESSLQQELEELRIEIDHSKRAHQVAQITQTDYFQMLQSQLEQLKSFDFDE